MSGVFDFAITSQAATMSGSINDGKITWTLTEVTPNGSLSESDKAYKLTLKGSGDMPSYTYETIKDSFGNSTYRTTAPWKESALGIQEIEIGSGITSVSTYAFYACTALTTVSIPESVTKIGSDAFNTCSSLLSVKLPSALKTIGSSAFQYCTDMKSINIPSGVTRIGTYAFASCSSLESISFPSNSDLDTIPDCAFDSCYKLKSVSIAEGIKKISSCAFRNCSVLENVSFPSTLQEIGERAFGGCSSSYKTTGLKEVDLSGTAVTTVSDRSFYQCYRLSGIKWPKNTLKKIGANAFSYTSIEELVIPASVTEITDNPYTKGELKKITVESGNTDFVVKNGILIELEQVGTEKQMYEAHCYPYKAEDVAVSVPSPVQIIGKSAFCYTPITKITLPASLREIESCAFEDCDKLTAVKVPGNVTVIDNYAFRYCDNLSDVTLGTDLEELGDGVFNGCKAIKEMTLPDKLTSIGNSVFYNCVQLAAMVLPNSLETIGSSVFSGCSALELVEIGQNLKAINGDVFTGCKKLGTIKISKNNPYIVSEDNIVYTVDKKNLIYYAAALPDDKFLIPDTVETVGSYAFAYATELKELRVPESVKTMEKYAVYYNEQLSKVLFYGDAPEVAYEYSATSSSWNSSLGAYSYKYAVYNGSIYKNKTGKDKKTYDNDGLVIASREEKTGFDYGWQKNPKDLTNTTTRTYTWSDKTLFTTWDPDKTDKAEGSFGNLKWSYRDDIGELSFSGSGKTDNYTADKLPTWGEDGTDHLKDVKLVDTTEATSVELGDYVLYGATGVLRLNAGKELTKIGSHAFAGCTAMKVLAVQNTPEIGESAFEGNISLVDEVDLRGAKTIGKNAFKDCAGMTGVLFGNSLKTLGEGAFSNCVALESVILTEKVTALPKQCFYGCKALRTINIPKSVTTIGDGCFDQCSGLKKIYFYGDYPTEFSYNALDNCHNDLVIYYRSGNDTWVNNANIVEHKWNGIPVQEQDKFYTEKQDYYSFANTQSSFGYGSYYKIPRQRYVTAVQSTIRGSYYYAWNKEWSGNCFGMAASTTEFYDGDQFNVADYTQGATSLYDVKAPGNSEADLTKIIEIYQVSQFAESISDEIGNNYGKYKKLVKSVEEFERSGGISVDEEADPLVLCVYSDYTGHALVPVSVDIDDNGDYIMQVYDCNSPGGFAELKVKGDFSGIEYKTMFVTYKYASFVKYSTIRDALEKADFSGEGFQKKEKSGAEETKESTKVTVAVNREDVTVENSTGKDYTEIKGAYEQRLMSDAKEDVFSGTRSFVLPENEYQIKVDEKSDAKTAENTKDDDLAYYVATEDMFSEIQTTDEDAGYDVVTLTTTDTDAETELTVLNSDGKEANISVKGKTTVRAEVTEDDDIDLMFIGAYDEVTINGETVDVENGEIKGVEFKEVKEEEKPAEPVVTPTVKPTETPVVTPTVKPTETPVVTPTVEPTETPVVTPTVEPTETPVVTPTVEPTATPEVTWDPSVPRSTPHVTTLPIPTTEASKAPATTTPTQAPVTATPEATKAPETTGSAAPIETPEVNVPTATAVPSVTPEADEEDVDYEVAVYNTKKEVKEGTIVSAPSGKYMVTKKSGTRTVAYYGLKKKTTKKLIIPRRIKIGKKYYKVTTIRAGAVQKASQLKAVFIGNNVTTIGKNAFKNCKNLKFVRMGKKVTKIGKGAFRGCKKFDSLVILSNKIKTVGSNSFKGVSTDIVVKTPTDKCKEYKKLLIKDGGLTGKASFVGELVAIYYGGKRY